MQILYEKNKKYYILFTRWGRLGDTWGGQFQRTPFQTLKEAKAEWCKVFRQKFSNTWDDGNYHPVTGKYKLKVLSGRRMVDYQPEDQEETGLRFSRRQFNIDALLKPFKSDKLPTAKYPDELVEFIRPIANSNVINQAFNSSGVGSSFFLLTVVDPAVLEHAKDLLNKLEKKIKKLERSRRGNEQFTVAATMEEIVELTNEYYDLIPPIDVSNSALRPIQNIHEIEQNRKKLTGLYDISIATKLLLGARLRKYEFNPYDYLLHNMNVKLRTLDPKTKEF